MWLTNVEMSSLSMWWFVSIWSTPTPPPLALPQHVEVIPAEMCFSLKQRQQHMRTWSGYTDKLAHFPQHAHAKLNAHTHLHVHTHTHKNERLWAHVCPLKAKEWPFVLTSVWGFFLWKIRICSCTELWLTLSWCQCTLVCEFVWHLPSGSTKHKIL